VVKLIGSFKTVIALNKEGKQHLLQELRQENYFENVDIKALVMTHLPARRLSGNLCGNRFSSKEHN
jgi:hypothetical protein